MNPQLPINRHRFYIDIPLLLLILCLIGISLTVLYSIDGLKIMLNQALRFGVGLLAMVIILLIPRNFIRFFAPMVYVITIVMLIGVYFFGISVNSSQRWLYIGIVHIQPSELAKVTIPLMLAYYYSTRSLPPSIKDMLISLLIIMLPFFLVLKQPDLGSALLLLESGFILLFFAGISWRLILSLATSVLVIIPIYWFNGMKSYQKKRIITTLNPESDPTGDGYNIIQSKIAIGSGGIDGKGFMQAVQSREFLPENTTDFIFAAFSEQFGLIGVILLLLVYLAILLRSCWLTMKMTDNFSRLLSGSLVFIFFSCFFINIGMVSGILPVVGLPLPLVSFGGTSIIATMISFALIMNLYATRDIKKRVEIW